MSDTDDTDDLLLIPPDFFTVNSDIEDPLEVYGPYYSVVNNLISHLYSLEDRVNHIESHSDSSPNTSNLMTSLRQISSADDLSKPESTQSTPQKPRNKVKQNSLPSTPHEVKQRPVRTRRPIVNLDEINTFISHVQNIQRHVTARNLNSAFDEHAGGAGDKNVNVLWERSAGVEKSWKLGDTRGSEGMRDLLYEIPSARNSESLSSDIASLSSSDSTQLTTVQKNFNKHGQFDSAFDVLEKHKNLLRGGGDVQNIAANKESKQKSVEAQRKLVLMSLSELWDQELTGAGDYSNKDQLKFYNKLQEEKLRRQHCEELIKHLQTRTLELQERLAVAVQVDEAKDDAILQIHKSWEEAAAKIDNLHKDKTNLELQIAEINCKTTSELSEAAKKVSHYENEASKALNLAHTNQEKLTVLEKQNVSLLSDNQSYEDRFKKLELDFEREHSNNLQLSQSLNQKELELTENRNVQEQATKEIAQSKRAVEMCQAELTSIKGKQMQLETKYNDALVQVKDVEGDKKKLLSEIENYKKTEKNLKDELSRIKDSNELEKVELRTYYQNQVEILVRGKLKEFQQQLEKAQSAMHDDLRSRELSVVRNAATHMQQLHEKNTMEIHLLEEKHKEELKLYKLQLFQSQQEISSLQQKFQQQQERRANIVQQLQKVMEAQWSEALKIINNGKSPILPQDKSTNTIDQLNHLKSRSYNNLEEILLRDDGNVDRNSAAQKVQGLKLFDSVSANTTLDDSFNKIKETPVSSRNEKNKHLENEFQKYVQLLLSKQPGHPVDEVKNQDGYENQDSKLNKAGSRDRLGKPPWK